MRRLDLELVKRGLANSRGKAQELIQSGVVVVNGLIAVKATTQVNDQTSIVVKKLTKQYVSRGALKLLSVLDKFTVDIAGLTCLDAGASTGGFTQVLLDRGALKVYAVDVGYGQLAWQLQQDNRVVVMDRTNIREIDPTMFHEPIDLITADLSFISLITVLPALTLISNPKTKLLLMVKPQFEVGKHDVGRGVVRDPQLRKAAISNVVKAATELGWEVIGAAESEVHGPSGNIEFFLHLARSGPGLTRSEILAQVSEEL